MAVTTHISRKLFDSYVIASTGYVYTENASTGADDGWVAARGDYVNVQTCIATHQYNATVIYRIEGRSETINRSASLFVGTVTATESLDETTVLSERMDEVRVGVKMRLSIPGSPLATPTYFHAGINVTEVS